MRKVGKLLSATVVVSTLVVGSSAAYISTNSTDTQAAEQVQKWGHGEGGASGASAQSTADLKAQTPWYNYEGYTTYDPSFTQDYNFVRALKYDNVTINGYKVNPHTDREPVRSEQVYDTTVDFNGSDEVVGITFLTKPNTISKDTFKEAHVSNQIVNKGEADEGTFLEYQTNAGIYTAYFDKNDKLMKIMINFED
ncbi:hypothetical protein EUA50_00355 [Staphylococcus saprophyticus]|uniref:immunodominant staphylococcal antigen IsaB family protein n=2 Tax=Staphylococcus saprophyticus TaxID=29385 RepID=UPI0010119F7A|nr:hypothetical protein [Staphylococcus saprophyticus]MBN6093415.1 hypothetical protein [Staphylococcus saprophyticus]MBN6097139.1 hypothetical protein [Staphylococcus saprophyticus]MBN6098345.1 hypothetical protein [Staphylococcus saprophyticus]MDW4233691.1 hypothetical protein [Staphylococcus saprophyticus]MDW4418400.1 hypothetical protein [Staphylococcus saprophyticus]